MEREQSPLRGRVAAMERRVDEMENLFQNLRLLPQPQPRPDEAPDMPERNVAPAPQHIAVPQPDVGVPLSRVYLDLAWEVQGERRVRQVCIQLYDCPLGRQFLQLCTGPPGLSYAGTRLLRRNGARIYGGNYDGNGGEALLQGLGRGTVSSNEAGAVCGVRMNGRLCAKFSIVAQGGPVVHRVFGMVDDGLDAVLEVHALPDVTRVTVEDCGLVE